MKNYKNKPGFVYDKLERRDHWVGYRSLLWSHEVATWLYNDENGSIILEITPIFPGDFYDEDKTSYNQWIQNYKPYLLRKLSKEVAQQWLDQADCLLKKIEENIKKNLI